MEYSTDLLNALVLISNYVLIPAISYGSQLALGAVGVTLVFGILRFANFAHGEMMAFGCMATIFITWWFQSMGVLCLVHICEHTRRYATSSAVFCLNKQMLQSTM